MKRILVTAALAAALSAACSPAVFAAEPEKPAASAPAPAWPADSVTRHQIVVGGKAIAYQATAGTLTLSSPAGAETGRMFYVAYVADQPKGAPPRPLTFVYNGGPGSSSIWLHMGAFGPKRVETAFPKPESSSRLRFVDNPDTLLDKTDLVFLDAMQTGYSRAVDAEAVKGFMGHDQDSAAFSQAIRRYLEKSGRWRSPKFLMGESYGATRSAMLAYRLQADNIDLAGITLISSILNFGDLAPGLDRGTVNLLPTFAAIARYHGKAARGDEAQLNAEIRAFADGPYATALAKGHNLSDAERDAVAVQLARYTGLSVDYLKRANLRIETGRFRRELLRAQGQVTGEMDGRAVGVASDGVGERPDFDPAEGANAAYVAAFHDYMANDLNYRPAMPYNVIDGNMFMVWDWSHQPPEGDRQISMADVALDLSAAMRHDPNLKVLSLNGAYDLITPVFATEYDLAHMALPRDMVGNIEIHTYPSGHMIYLDAPSRTKMKADLTGFYDKAAPR